MKCSRNVTAHLPEVSNTSLVSWSFPSGNDFNILFISLGPFSVVIVKYPDSVKSFLKKWNRQNQGWSHVFEREGAQ